MKLAILKYGPVTQLNDPIDLKIPDEAEIVHVGMKDDNIWVWARADVEARPGKRRFVLVGTGPAHDTPDWADGVHRGTVIDGAFVWHLFEYAHAREGKI